VPASAENFVWESMSNNTGQINGTWSCSGGYWTALY
jgi:hypothetical protein